ncbi:MAG: Spore germination protein YaaH/Spore germination protein YaaH [Chloroflexi bacterium]|jgi:hypothetical protein|nr:MAG: Spore germination protein YaaH/Spore germination protein YaaH [Chloroflexota bacterium]|tara:strand:- start:1726 stop:3624 length:1899 start_codon:yes stop_codon:yes gene_type:complete
MDNQFDNNAESLINKDIFDEYNFNNDKNKKKKKSRNILVLFVMILFLALIYFNILPTNFSTSSASQENDTPQYKVTKEDLPSILPIEFSLISNYYNISVLDPDIIGKKISISLRLISSIQNQEKAFFYYYNKLDGQWIRLSEAVISNDKDIQIATAKINNLPDNILVISAPERIRELSVDFCPACDISSVPKVDNSSIFMATPNISGVDGTVVLKNLYPNKDFSELNFDYGLIANDKRASEIINFILEDSNRIDNHIQNIILEATKYGAKGIHINYQNLKNENRDAFSLFLSRLSDAKEKANFTNLIVSIPTYHNFNEGPFNWKNIASSVNKIWVHTSDEESKHYEELDILMDNLHNIEMNNASLHLVIDSISKERSINGIESISILDALKIATQFDILISTDAVIPNSPITLKAKNLNSLNEAPNNIYWDSKSKSVTYRYKLNNSERTIWFHNSFSLRFQLHYANKYNFKGVVFNTNQLDDHTNNYWTILTKYLSTTEVELVSPYDDYVKLNWTTSGGNFENNDGKNTTWRSPKEPGVYKIQLNVSDGEHFLLTESLINVVSAKSIAIFIDQIMNSLPKITLMLKEENAEIKQVNIEMNVANVDKKVDIINELKVVHYRPMPSGPPGPAGN